MKNLISVITRSNNEAPNVERQDCILENSNMLESSKHALILANEQIHGSELTHVKTPVKKKKRNKAIFCNFCKPKVLHLHYRQRNKCLIYSTMLKQFVIVLVILLGFASAQYVTLQQFQCMFPQVKASKINTWLPSLNDGNNFGDLFLC